MAGNVHWCMWHAVAVEWKGDDKQSYSVMDYLYYHGDSYYIWSPAEYRYISVCFTCTDESDVRGEKDMKCNFCRNDIPDEAKFCPICGAPVESEEKMDQENVQQGADQPYQYGAENQNQQEQQYQYGVPEANQQYQYGSANENQNNYGQTPYGQTPYGQSAYGQNAYNQPVKQISGTPYMIFAIFTTLLCCMPLGIAAIVFASKINSCQRMGDYAGAQNAAKKAKLFSIIGAAVGLVVTILYIVVFVMGMKESSVMDTPPAVVEDLVDRTDEVTPSVPVPTVPSGELGAAWDSYTVQVNDTVLTFPCTIAELEAAGLKLDTEYTPENYVVNANEYELAYFQDGNDNEVMVYAVNNSDAAIEVKDCMIGGLSVDDYDLEKGGLTIVFPGGIQMGAARENVEAAYGVPDDVYEGDSLIMLTWYADDDYYKSCEIDFDTATGLVCSMDMQNFGN